LFTLEDEQVELLLQSLVTVIDAQLLERVELERFKTENIQNTNRCGFGKRLGDSFCRLVVNLLVDSIHNKVEHGSIRSLDKGLKSFLGTIDRQLTSIRLVTNTNLVFGHGGVKGLLFNTQQFQESIQMRAIVDLGGFISRCRKSQIGSMQKGDCEGKYIFLCLRFEAHGSH
jgi:hypothetical protein